MNKTQEVLERWAREKLQHDGYALTDNDHVRVEKRDFTSLTDGRTVIAEVFDIYVNDDLETVYNVPLLELLDHVIEIAQNPSTEERNRSIMQWSFERPRI